MSKANATKTAGLGHKQCKECGNRILDLTGYSECNECGGEWF
jgi:hypothetical protein